MVRLILTDEQWSRTRMEPHCLGKPRDPGRNGTDNGQSCAFLSIARQSP